MGSGEYLPYLPSWYLSHPFENNIFKFGSFPRVNIHNLCIETTTTCSYPPWNSTSQKDIPKGNDRLPSIFRCKLAVSFREGLILVSLPPTPKNPKNPKKQPGAEFFSRTKNNIPSGSIQLQTHPDPSEGPGLGDSLGSKKNHPSNLSTHAKPSLRSTASAASIKRNPWAEFQGEPGGPRNMWFFCWRTFTC